LYKSSVVGAKISNSASEYWFLEKTLKIDLANFIDSLASLLKLSAYFQDKGLDTQQCFSLGYLVVIPDIHS